LMTPAEMQYQVCGDYENGRGFGSESKVLSNAPNIRVVGWRSSDGPHGIRWPLGPTSDDYIYGEGDIVTLFPTEASLGCTWDTSIARKVGQAIGKEARSMGLFCNLGPMSDLVINPRWGRAFETIGEDPILGGYMSASMSIGLQNEKVIATPKHFAPYVKELERYTLRVVVPEQYLREQFCVPFEMAIKKGGARALMTCYNKVRVPGYTTDTASQIDFGAEWAGTNKHLLTDIVRNDWGFNGTVCTDWGGVEKVASVRYVFRSELDMDMPSGLLFGTSAWLVTIGGEDISILKRKVKRVIYNKLWACNGKFPASDAELKTQPQSVILSPEHKSIALEAARKCIVLARNEAVGDASILPLNKNSPLKIAVVGTYSNRGRFGGGGSSAVKPDTIITPLKGIQAITAGTGVTVTTDYNAAGVNVAIVVVGVEKETEDGERPDLSLPDADLALVTAVMAKVPKTIVVYTGGSASVAGSWSTAPGVLIAFYPGRFQGQAIAEVLFGEVNPSGHLGVTFPKLTSDLPNFNLDQGQLVLPSADTAHGYFYFEKTQKQPLFWFGHGLSYTRFAYTNMTVVGSGTIKGGDRLDVMVNVKNIGQLIGDDVVQLYVKPVNSTVPRRVKDLRAFARISLAPNEMKTVTFTLGPRDFSVYETDVVNKTGRWKVLPGQYQLIATSTADPTVIPDGSAVIQTIRIN
jgi:beta-glucosidase